MAITTDFNQTDPIMRAVADMRNVIGKEHIAFQDDALQSYLRLQGVDEGASSVSPSSIKMAAALAVDTLASDKAALFRVIETLGMKIDGAKLADALRAHAIALREEVSNPPAPVSEAPTSSGAPRGKSIGSQRIDGYSRCGRGRGEYRSGRCR